MWYLPSFIGFPSRIGEDYWQIIRNFFGGWDSLIPDGEFSTEGKRFWNIFVLPIKLGLILPLKIIGIPFKFALNLIKLFTEFLPEIIVNFTGSKLLYTLSGMIDPDCETIWGTILGHIGYALLSLGLGVIHTAARILLLVGTAFTSPEKSARDAWEFGRRLDVPVLGTLFGTLGAAMSITLTTVLWTIALPFAVNQLLALIPSLAPLLTTISQWPVVASCLNFVQGMFSALPTAFTTLGSALSIATGIVMDPMVLAITVSLATIAGLVTTVCSRIADGLSNA